MDDLVFGWIFWAVAWWNQVASTVLAFIASFSFQVWLVHAGLREKRGKVAQGMLDKLMLSTRSMSAIEQRERAVKKTVVGIVSAVIVTPLIGSVIPVLLLAKQESLSTKALKRLSLILAALYALEFCLIHGGYGISLAIRSTVQMFT
ncbi:hypothetical protein HY312_01980 [Candidatus Saccharibacteria bacterium]|nr:hypothetical protein [Candidatus Saccharibacteria bacterium]